MLAYELTSNIIPQLKLTDSISKALQLMSDFKITHLPVVSEEKFLGLISEDDLLDEENKKTLIEYFHDDFVPASINANNHFLLAVNISTLYQTNVIPVINDQNDLLGTISGQSLITALGDFAGGSEPGALIELQIEKNKLNISEINRIVESDGATILHLNIAMLPEDGAIKITININKREISTLIAAFERYEYSISFYSGEELFENDIDSNYRHLMNYLDI
ncbi:MAG: CBS domain-containing protein [Ginsengibacter sp.]